MFDKDYYVEVENLTERVFYNSNIVFPGIDIVWFIDYYMRSDVRRQIDLSNPRYMCMESIRTLDYLKRDGLLDYPKSDKTIDNYYGDSIIWVAMMYCHLQLYFGFSSKDLSELIPCEEMLKAFVVGHERGFRAQAEHMYDAYLRDKLPLPSGYKDWIDN